MAYAIRIAPEVQNSLLAAGMLLLGLLAGYGARKTRLLQERWGRPLHLFNIVALQANISWMTMWGVVWQWNLIRLPAAGLLVSVALTLAALALARLYGFDRRDRGTFALCCGMSNLGSTGGLLVIVVLVNQQALQHGTVYLLYWTFFVFLFCFPFARYCGSKARLGVVSLILKSVVDIRVMPLLALVFGLLLNHWGPARPAFVPRLVNVLIMASSFMAMFAIGVTLHLRKVKEYVGTYVTQAGVKFLVGPAVALVLVHVMGFDSDMRKTVVIMASMSQAFYSVMIANLFDLNIHMANSMFLVNTLTFLIVVFPVLGVLI